MSTLSYKKAKKLGRKFDDAWNAPISVNRNDTIRIKKATTTVKAYHRLRDLVRHFILDTVEHPVAKHLDDVPFSKFVQHFNDEFEID